MPPMNERAASSTEGFPSDDFSGIEYSAYISNLSPSDPSMLDENNNNDADDDESLIVNDSMTRIGSTTTVSNSPIIVQKKSKSTRHQVSRFRGLSKSASHLLEQDEVNLTELLDVEPVQVAIDTNDDNSRGLHSKQRNDVPHKINQDNLTLIIQELEQKLARRDREIAIMHHEWERKLHDTKVSLEQKYQQYKVELEEKYAIRTQELEEQLEMLEQPKYRAQTNDPSKSIPHMDENLELTKMRNATLTQDQLSRYSRQLLLKDGFGIIGQQKLLKSKVLVIGAGGIGSTVLLYLAASGVGEITVVDFDHVDMSNLHRQVIHQNRNVGMNKAVSACKAMKELNPTIKCTAVQEMLTFDNALEWIEKHDCVVDACDNPQTRYMVNDACVLSGKPLISGSAMGSEGQLTVYGYTHGTCYRCLYPKPNPVEGNKSCSDSGVLGPVPGMIGILQALEVMKILTGVGSVMDNKLLMYDSLNCSFVTIKKPPPRGDCKVCSVQATIHSMLDSKEASVSIRGPQMCGAISTKVLPESLNVSCKDYYTVMLSKAEHILLDVRVKQQYDLCAITGAINIDLANLESKLDEIRRLAQNNIPIYCICRRGIASQEAVSVLLSHKFSNPIYNIKGGLNAWVKEVDSHFPMY